MKHKGICVSSECNAQVPHRDKVYFILDCLKELHDVFTHLDKEERERERIDCICMCYVLGG